MRLLLARGAAVDARANDGGTSLMIASEDGHLGVVRELLARGADVNAQSGTGRTPLISACDAGHLAAATLLLDTGADLALLNNAGNSALIWAERRVAGDVAPPMAGTMPPTAAQRREHKALVKLLKARGAV